MTIAASVRPWRRGSKRDFRYWHLTDMTAMSDLSSLCAAQRTLTQPFALVLYVFLNDASQAVSRTDA